MKLRKHTRTSSSPQRGQKHGGKPSRSTVSRRSSEVLDDVEEQDGSEEAEEVEPVSEMRSGWPKRVRRRTILRDEPVGDAWL